MRSVRRLSPVWDEGRRAQRHKRRRTGAGLAAPVGSDAEDTAQMAHLIEDDARYFEAGDEHGNGLAWHKLGTVIPRGEQATMTVTEAFKRGGLWFDVNTYPLMYERPDGTVVKTDKFVIVRSEHEFGGETHQEKLLSSAVVTDGYVPISNADIASALEPIRERWPIETCGVLRGGKVIFAAFDAGEFSIKGGDHHRMFFTAMESKDGSGAMKIFVTPVRTVCNNTLIMGLDAAEWTAQIGHTKDAYKDLEFWSRVAPQLAEKSTKVKEVLDALAETKATTADIERMLRTAFPEPKGGHKMRAADFAVLTLNDQDVQDIAEEQRVYELDKMRCFETRELVLARYDTFNQTNPATAGTLFAACNALNEVAMWTPGRGRSLYEQQLVGVRADTSKRAFRTAVAIMDGKPSPN